MNNYIILNGVNSNTITGLIISSLPPITKPLMRTNIETIDGKDGDIITKLGYSAYDKEITIGLSYNYNVDDVIKYFNSEGTVIFSNEPTKYYKYTILDQIDFERLIRFKTATVRMHVQPFKYSTTEEDIEENATETDAEGTNFTLENTENNAGFIDLKLKGDTYQETTTGKNLLPQDQYVASRTVNGITYTNNGDGTFNLSGTATANTTIVIIPANIINLEVNQPYYLYGSVPYNGTTFNMAIPMTDNGTSKFLLVNNTYTPTTTPTNVRLQFYLASGQSVDQTNIKLMLVKGTTAPSNYEKYTDGIASPNPNYPQDIDVVTGENTVTLCGKNLFDKDNANIINAKFSNNVITGDNYERIIYIPCQPNTTYTLSKVISSPIRNSIGTTQTLPSINVSIDNATYSATSPKTITTNANAKYIVWQIYSINDTNYTLEETFDTLQIVKGQATPYAPYQGQSYTLSLGDIELCKIGEYQDYIYYDNGKWYIEKNVGKYQMTGNETLNSWYNISNDNIGFYFYYNKVLNGNIENAINGRGFCNSFSEATHRVNISNGNVEQFKICGLDTSYIAFGLNKNKLSDYSTKALAISSAKTWLQNNRVIVYYVLETPTTTEITNETLLSQLNALKGATTYEGQTNIITAGDLQPIIYVKTFAMDNPSYTITNSGNYFAKPVMTIYGIGTVGVYLDGVQVLSLALNENQTDHITIDVPNMNAYTDTLNTLRNRAVIGDYNNLKFNVGDNELSFSGTIQGFIIQNYSRWL